MAINWTEKQKKAIEKSGCNLIVSAAAGSGKTAVLVERIIQKIILKNIDIDSLLVTTFTEAAAAKMKEDIKSAVEAKILENDSNAGHLSRQLILIQKADISTIHAFCLRVIKSQFHMLDLDPEFRIGNENETDLIKENVLAELFDEKYESGGKAFYELLDAYSSQRGDDALKETILNVYEFVKSMPFYENWINMVKNDYECLDDFENTKFFDYIKKQTEMTVKKYISKFRICCEICEASPSLSSYESAFMCDIATLESILDVLKSGNIKKTGEGLSCFSPTYARAKKGADEGDKDYIQNVRKKAKEDIRDIYVKYFKDSEKNTENLKKSKTRVCEILDLICEFDKRFTEAKREKAIVDFNDLEHLCLGVLADRDESGNIVPSECAKRLRDKYEEILIDEYQDANEMQEMIFSLISKGDNVFMVGDLKQSIYRFRHTDPMIFKRKIESYSDDCGSNQRVIMSENFRSRESIINLVNFIFSQVSSERIGEMTYDENERLNFAAKYPEDENGENKGSCELILVKSGAGSESNNETGADDEEDDSEMLAGLEAEAQAISRKIRSLVSGGFVVYDKKCGYRKVKYSDIVILMRSPSSVAEIFSKALEENGIGCFADVGASYFETEEIGVVMNLLSVIDNPRQDIALLSVMRSPIFSFTDEEFVYIRMDDYDNDIYESVKKYAGCGENKKLAEKCADFLKKLEKWRGWAVYMHANELIDALYKDTNYYAYVGAMTGGDVRRANLRLLYKRAEEFEKTSYKGLFNFINYIENTNKKNKKSKESRGARMLGENQDVVRIMSIHKSKGLEFPVVFVSCLSRKFNMKDLSKPVLMHKVYGVGVDFIDYDLRYKYTLPIKNVIRSASRDEMLSEELRLLYVALTRAREKLIMVAAPSDFQSSMKKWEEIAASAENVELPVYSCAEAKNYCDWIVPACMRSAEGYKLTCGHVAVLDGDADLRIEVVNEVFKNEEYEYNDTEKVSGKNVSDEVLRIVDYNYDKRGSMIPQKLSVTELKRIFNTELDGESYIADNTRLLKMPQFLSSEEEITGTLCGTATHYIMQKIDISRVPQRKDVENLAEELYQSGFFTKQQRDAVNVDTVLKFFESDLAKRMILSKNAVREIPFEINIGASQIYSDYQGNEKILVQGIIDCYFEEENSIVLLDYKTDSVYNINDELISKYKIQLDVYAEALRKIAGNKNVEKYIYFFSNEQTLRL